MNRNPWCGPLRLRTGDFGQCGRNRTCDPLLPKQVRYRAALHTDGRITGVALLFAPVWGLQPPHILILSL
jgi:hypothetical protein